jgi:hypothetical protein
MDAIYTDPLDLLLEEDAPVPEPTPRRFALILVAGIALMGLAAVTRTALDAAAPAPPGSSRPTASKALGIDTDPRMSVARYELERTRGSR